MSVNVTGKAIKLDENRSVFVGRIEGDADSLAVCYKNNGQDLKFKLSMEAAEATQYLINVILDEIVGENKVA